MITPVFSIKQEDDYLIFTIRAPYAKISDTEIEYAEEMFAFSSKPYFLRVHLPCHVLDNDTGTADYNSDEGSFIVRVPKLNKGEFFPNLDMITELLRPQRPAPSAAPLVEEVEGSGDEDAEEDGEIEEGDGEEYCSEQVPKEMNESIATGNCGYGFGWKRAGVLGKLTEEIGKLVELPNVEESVVSERVQMCREDDVERFGNCVDHYLGDSLQPDEELTRIISLPFPSNLVINDEDRERLKNLPAKKLPILSSSETYHVSLSLIDILGAYCYDLRTNDWEHSVESGWTIAHLSPSLCWLVKWQNGKEAVEGLVTKMLTRPLYRNWDLIQKVLSDLKTLLKAGRSSVVHCLCDIHSLMVSSGEFRYLLNELMITDILIWIQGVEESVLERLREEVEGVEISKGYLVDFALEEWEMEGRMQLMSIEERGEGAEKERKEEVDSDDLPEDSDDEA